MKMPWHKRDPRLLARNRDEVNAKYSDLGFFIKDETVFVRGSFHVLHEDQVLDRYQIEIELPPDWPDSIPVLREVGGRIPVHKDRHINRGDETSCLLVPEEWLLSPQRDSLRAFLDGPVHDFFLGQSLVEVGEPWPFGERAHGMPGLLQSYGEMLGTEDPATVRRYLECLGKKEVKGHWECPCGSNQRLRNCHFDHVVALRQKIPSAVALKALARLNSH